MLTRVLLPLLFGLAGIAVLVWLGMWQVQRLAWKEGVLAEIDARITAAPVPVPAEPVEARDKYLPVEASGVMGDRELHVLVSQKHVGAGYRIIAPLTLDDGRRILLDRGFTVSEHKNTLRAKGQVAVTGNLHWPDEKGASIPDPDTVANIWFAREVPAMAAALDTLPVMLIARDTTPTDPNVTPLPVDSSGIPNDHLSYAITWFSLAVVWAIMTAAFLWRGAGASRQRRRTKGAEQ